MLLLLLLLVLGISLLVFFSPGGLLSSSSASSPALLENGLYDVVPGNPLRKLGSVGDVTSYSSSSEILAKDEAEPGPKGFVPGKLELEAIFPAYVVGCAFCCLILSTFFFFLPFFFSRRLREATAYDVLSGEGGCISD